VARIGERNATRVLVGILEGKKTAGKHMDRCEEFVKVRHRDNERECGLKSVGAG
jgi:hypothetical protein